MSNKFADLGFEPVETVDAFDSAFKRTLGFEGGYTVDHAGATNFGVTQDTYDNWRKKQGLPTKPVRAIDTQEAKQLYKQEYFDKPGFSKLPANVAGVLFDYGVNAGTPRAAMSLQKAVGASPDGVIGSKTLNKVNEFVSKNGEQPLLQKIVDQRSQHIDTLIKKNPAKYKKFENGWKNRIKAIKSEFKLSDLNPFSVTEASADEGVQNDFTDLGFEEAATPTETLPQTTGNFDDLGFQPEQAIAQLSASKNFDKSVPLPEKMEATPADFDFFTQNLADKLATASSGQTVPEMIESKNKLSGIIMRAPMLAMAPVAPIASAVVEGLNQAKNLIVSSVKKEKYSPIEIRVLNELLPKETPTAVRIAAMGGEALTDVALLGGLSNLAKQGLLKDTIKEIGMKLERAGYGTGQKTINMDVVKEAARGSTLDIEAERWLKAKFGDVKPKNNIGTTTPENPVAGIAESPVAPKPSTSVEPVQPKPATPVERAAQHGEVVGIDAKSGLPVIDTSVKPAEKESPILPFETKDGIIQPSATPERFAEIVAEAKKIKEIKSVIGQAGGKFTAITDQKNSLYEDEPTIYYDTPSGSPQTIRPSQLNVENVKAKIDKFENIKPVEAAQTTTPNLTPKQTEALAPSTDDNIRIIDGEKFYKVSTAQTAKEGFAWFNNGKSRFSEGYKSIQLPDRLQQGGDLYGKSQEAGQKGNEEKVLIPEPGATLASAIDPDDIDPTPKHLMSKNKQGKIDTMNGLSFKVYGSSTNLNIYKDDIVYGREIGLWGKETNLDNITPEQVALFYNKIQNSSKPTPPDTANAGKATAKPKPDVTKYSNTFTDEDKADIKTLTDIEINMPNGERWVYQDPDSSEITYSGNPSGHSETMQSIGIKESFKILAMAQEGKPLTKLQKEKVDSLLADFRANIKPSLERLDNEIAKTTADLTESETKEVISAFENEEGIAKPFAQEASNITPSGQIRPELLPPERKELFQEEGEMFKKPKGDPASKKLPPHLQKIVDQQKGIDDVTPEGYGPSKGLESSSGGRSIDDYESRTPQQKDAEFKLFKAVQDLAKKWVKSSIGEKYAPKKSSGVRFKDTGTILVRSMNNLAVMVHEVTHDIAKRTSLIADVMKVKGYAKNGNPIYAPETKPARKEFTDIYVKYYGGGKADHKLELRVNEGLSVLIQRMAEAPSLTKKEFPYLAKEVLTLGGKYYDPQYTELIADAEKIVEMYQSLSPLNKIGARVITSGRDIDKKNFLSVPERIVEESVDRIYPIEKMAKESGLSGTINDPSLWARAYNVIRYIALENINTKKGYVTIKDGEFKKIYDFNWKSLLDNLHKEGGDKNIEDFSYWLVARQTHYLYERLDRLKTEATSAVEDLKEMSEGVLNKEEINAAKEKIAEYKELNEIIKNDNIKRELADAAFKSEEKRFKTHAEMFDKLIRADLDLLHSPEVQLVNDKRYEKLTAEEGYAPRQRDIFNEVIGSPTADRPVARSLTGKNKISSMLGRTGSDLPIISPVYGAMMNHLEILKKANRQIVYNIIGEKVASHYPELFQKLPLERVVSDDGRISYPQEKDPNIMMTYSGQKRVPYLVDKEVKTMVDELFAFEDMHLLEKALRKATSMFVKGTTALYPPFAISNFIIDQFTAVAQTRNNLVPVLSQLKVLYKALSTHGSKEAEYFKEYLALGGERHTLVEISELSPEDSYRELLKERDMLHKIGGLISDGVNLLSIPSKWSEIFTRGTEYVLARQAGKPQLAALEEAGRVTAPFHHEGRAGGHVGRSAVKAYPYLKAGMQVLAQSARSMADNPKSRARFLFALAALTASGIGAMAYFINNASDDQKDLYKALRPNELSGYIFFPAPDRENLIRIRVPDQMNVVSTFVNMLIADKMMDAKYRPYDYVSGATSFLPDQLNVTDPQRQFLSLIPQHAAPLVGISTNKRLYPDVRPLESQSMLARPAKYRYYENTSQAALWLGDKLNLSPVKIDFLVEGYAGRAMKFATGKEIPNVMLRKMYIESSRQVQDYYDLSEKVDQERKALRDGLRKEKYSTESKELNTLNTEINKVKKNLDKFRDIKKTDRNDPELKKLRRDILDGIDSLPKDIDKDNYYFKKIRKDIVSADLKTQQFLQSPVRR